MPLYGKSLIENREMKNFSLNIKSSGQDVRRTFFLAESMVATKIGIIAPSRYHSNEVRRTFVGYDSGPLVKVFWSGCATHFFSC